MKTATRTVLLVTNSTDTQRLMAEAIGGEASFVSAPVPSEASAEKFDALFATWLRMADTIVLDAITLGESARWAIESLSRQTLADHQPVIARVTAVQQTMFSLPAHWLVVGEADAGLKLTQSVRHFLELRNVQAKLQRQVPAAPVRSLGSLPAPLPADLYRYRDALKSVSRVMGQQGNEAVLLAEFSRLVRELLGVGKLALFTRPLQVDLFSDQLGFAGNLLSVVGSTGISTHAVEHLRLTLETGIGGYVAQGTRILRRDQTTDADERIQREFEVLGTEVAVPMFDNDQLLGVLTFSGKITGEMLTSEELQLVYHLLEQLAQALRNLHLQEKIAGQQRFMSEVLAHVQSGVVVVGQDARILTMNRVACALLDLDATEMAGQDLSRLPSRVADLLYGVLQTGVEARECEVVLPRSKRPVGVNATRFATTLGGAGKLATVALLEDLTQAKIQQARMRETADKEFLTRLSFRLQHELKNSLASIKAFAQLLPEQYNDKEFRGQFSQIVTGEVNRMDVLVNNLTFFSQTLALVHEEVVLSELLEACVKNVAQEFERKKLARVLFVGEKAADGVTDLPVVTVKKNFTHKAVTLARKGHRLKQAFEHVLRNALQALPQGGRLAISTADALPADYDGGELPAGGAVRIDWQDSGEGIALEDLARVTEPFVTTRNVGVGLGLTIVKRIIERHGGRLEIDSLLGRGTKLTMLVPVKAQPHVDDILLEQPVATGDEAHEAGGAELPASRLTAKAKPAGGELS